MGGRERQFIQGVIERRTERRGDRGRVRKTARWIEMDQDGSDGSENERSAAQEAVWRECGHRENKRKFKNPVIMTFSTLKCRRPGLKRAS